MTKENKEFVYDVFVDYFKWMEASDIEILFEELEEEICGKIDDVVGDDFGRGDVCIAVRLTLFDRLNIEE